MATMRERWERARSLMAAREATLQAGDFKGLVRVVHSDGSVMVYANAFAEKWDDGEGEDGEQSGTWLLVFTEHMGYHAFPTRDLDQYAMYGPRVSIPAHRPA